MLFADKEAQVINFLSAHDAFKSYIFAHFSKKKMLSLYSAEGK